MLCLRATRSASEAIYLSLPQFALYACEKDHVQKQLGEDGIYLAYPVIVHHQRKQRRNWSRDRGVKLHAGLLRPLSYTLQDHCSGIALLKVGWVPLYRSVKKMPHRLDCKPVWRGMLSIESPSFQITLECANLTNQLAQQCASCTLSACLLVKHPLLISVSWTPIIDQDLSGHPWSIQVGIVSSKPYLYTEHRNGASIIELGPL